MPIVNHTKNAVIADSFEECATFWQQLRGMMFRKEVVPLVFRFSKEQTVNLHSHFCPDAMDLLFLDETWEVVEMHSEWQPKSTYKSRAPAMFLLELPAGSIWKSSTEVGDVVQILK